MWMKDSNNSNPLIYQKIIQVHWQYLLRKLSWNIDKYPNYLQDIRDFILNNPFRCAKAYAFYFFPKNFFQGTHCKETLRHFPAFVGGVTAQTSSPTMS
jgi:hypothetical protein